MKILDQTGLSRVISWIKERFLTKTDAAATYATKAVMESHITASDTLHTQIGSDINGCVQRLDAVEPRVEAVEGDITALNTFKDETVPQTYATRELLSDHVTAFNAFKDTTVPDTYATKTELTNGLSSKAALTDFNTFKNTTVPGTYLTKTTATNTYATKSDFNNHTGVAAPYAKTTDISNTYATKTALKAATDDITNLKNNLEAPDYSEGFWAYKMLFANVFMIRQTIRYGEDSSSSSSSSSDGFAIYDPTSPLIGGTSSGLTDAESGVVDGTYSGLYGGGTATGRGMYNMMPCHEFDAITRMKFGTRCQRVHYINTHYTPTAISFQNCTELTQINCTIPTGHVTSYANMFRECAALTRIGGFSTITAATSAAAMFYNCSALTTIPAIKISSVTTINGMFYGCTALTQVEGTLNIQNVASVSSTTFNNCTALVHIVFENLGKAQNATTYDLSKITAWDADDCYASLYTNSYNRASQSGWATATVKLASAVKNRLTSAQIANIQSKGYTLTV